MRGSAGRGVWWIAGLLLTVSSCTSGGDETADVPARGESSGFARSAPYERTWVASIATDPASFQSVLGASPGEGWQKLYQHKYADASAAFAGSADPSNLLGGIRADLARAELFASAWELSLTLMERGEKAYSDNADRIKQSPSASYFAAVRALHRGQGPEALAAIRTYRASPGVGGVLGQMAPAVEAAALKLTGDEAASAAMLKGLGSPDARVLAGVLMGRLGVAPTGEVPSAEGLSAYGQRARVCLLAELGRLEEAAAALATLDHKSADLVEPAPGGEGEHKYYDPILLQGVARLYARGVIARASADNAASAYFAARATQAMGGTFSFDPAALDGAGTPGLPALLFGPFATALDLKADAERRAGKVGTAGILHSYLGELGAISEQPDQGKQARQAQDVAKAWQDGLTAHVKNVAKEADVATVEQLQLARALSMELVRARAGEYNHKGRHMEALSLLEYSFEKENSSQISYINSPALFLEIARTYCLLGRYREAMNYLYRLLDDYPEFWSTYEILGNLSVLGTLDQPGFNAQ